MSERPGEAEALAIVRSPKFNTNPAQRLVDEQLVRTIYPIIAAAFRADEQAIRADCGCPRMVMVEHRRGCPAGADEVEWPARDAGCATP